MLKKRNFHVCLVILASAVVFAVFSEIAIAEVPQVINYQGRLTEEDGSTVQDGDYQLEFVIYDAPDEASGSVLWTSQPQMVSVVNGLFNYQLGSNTQLPDDLFVSDTSRWLGIKIGPTLEEIMPRAKLTSTAYTYHALRADTADYAISGAGGSGGWASEGSNITLEDTTAYVGIGTVAPGNHRLYVSSFEGGVPGASAFIKNTAQDGIGLIVENESSDLTLLLSQIGQGDIFRCDSYDGGWHPVFMISGDGSTTVGSAQYLSSMTVYGELSGCDSALTVNCDGVRIGDGELPTGDKLLTIERDYHTTDYRYGLDLSITNADVGFLYGIRSQVHNSFPLSGASCYGIYSKAKNDGIRYGIYCEAEPETFVPKEGWSYGIYTHGYAGEYAYGIYAAASGADVNWAGWFQGNVRVTGTFDNSKSAFVIDHPTDPENQYLIHSSVNSPDMKNVYDGVVTLDANGEAIVELPEYFSALNEDFRYQLTCIGGYAPVYIAEKITDNHFRISGGKSGMEVSWQVTGIRQDKFALSNRTQVEVEKPDNERGLYLNPEAYDMGPEKYVHYEQNKKARTVSSQDTEY
jgi:hypothetical protein